MDFKGCIRLANEAERCHPLTVIDGHSRFAAGLTGLRQPAGRDRSRAICKRDLRAPVRTAGGDVRRQRQPWGDASGRRWTRLARLASQARRRAHHQHGPIIRRAVARTSASIGRWRTSSSRCATSIAWIEAQRALDAWREVYNFEPPHEAIGLFLPFQPIAIGRPRAPFPRANLPTVRI